LYTRTAFWVQNNLCEFPAQVHKLIRWICTQKSVLKIYGIQK
jgi:hypothetical protein